MENSASSKHEKRQNDYLLKMVGILNIDSFNSLSQTGCRETLNRQVLDTLDRTYPDWQSTKASDGEDEIDFPDISSIIASAMNKQHQ